MEKESFILYNSFYEPIKTLKNEQLGKLFRAIFNYTINGEITKDNDILVAFMFIKNQLDMDNEKWQKEKEKRSEAGKKGMASRWGNKNNITNDNSVINSYNKNNSVINAITKITDNVNDNVNDNDNVNVINSSTSNIYEFIEENFGRTLSPIEFEIINNWEDNELTRYAIKQAVLNGKYNIKYISKILESYKQKNIKTVQQAQQDEEEYQKRKQNKNKTSQEKMDEVFERFMNGDS